MSRKRKERVRRIHHFILKLEPPFLSRLVDFYLQTQFDAVGPFLKNPKLKAQFAMNVIKVFQSWTYSNVPLLSLVFITS